MLGKQREPEGCSLLAGGGCGQRIGVARPGIWVGDSVARRGHGYGCRTAQKTGTVLVWRHCDHILARLTGSCPGFENEKRMMATQVTEGCKLGGCLEVSSLLACSLTRPSPYSISGSRGPILHTQTHSGQWGSFPRRRSAAFLGKLSSEVGAQPSGASLPVPSDAWNRALCMSSEALSAHCPVVSAETPACQEVAQ